MVAPEESSDITTMIDEAYEFSAPRFYDFTKGESEQETRKAELWFETALSYAPSPFMPRIKTSRSFKLESLCGFSEAADQMQKASEPDSTATKCTSEDRPEKENIPAQTKEEKVTPNEAKQESNQNIIDVISANKDDNCKEEKGNAVCTQENGSMPPGRTSSILIGGKETIKFSVEVGTEACTPKPLMNSQKGSANDKKHQTPKPLLNSQKDPANDKKHQTPKPLLNSQKDPATDKKHQTSTKAAGSVRYPSALKPRNQSSLAKSSIKPASVKRETNIENTTGAANLAQENQAIKKQKLDGGKSRQILNVKVHNLPHKSKLTSDSSNLCSSTAKMSNPAQRKIYVREPAAPAAPFISMAEMMKKFQSSTRDLSLPPTNSSVSHRKPKLTLTRPKEPEFETSQRVRSIRVKSTAELEEEMMAKIPKFKARPLNKKILEGPTLPALPRSTPKLPEFQEFHLETMERANQNAETSSVASTEVSRQNNQWKPYLTEPRSPVLHTSLRARPPKVKSSIELEQEELEKAPKFKARPLNKKVLESKGELGIFSQVKKQVTVPQEFHFATHERIPPPPPPEAVLDLFDKLSLSSEPCHYAIPRNTKPNPFHLKTEERGVEKETRFMSELMLKQLEDERARIPRANPYPYTTDYPVVPPKPDPKQCTKPEPFQLESLVRHEVEMQREMEERLRKEQEEAQMRIFRAQPVLKEDPIPVPEKVRKPLTQIQEFKHHVGHRAVDRAEFDQKIREKETMYKRYREESEAARMIEEEKALKQMRRTMVPHARPVPNFNHPFCPQKSSKETTKPKSPKLRVMRRKEGRKTVSSLAAAASSPATLMR